MSTLLRRVGTTRRKGKEDMSSMFVKKNAPSILSREFVKRVLGRVEQGFRVKSRTRVAVRMGPKATSEGGLRTCEACKVGHLDVNLRSPSSERLGVLKEVRGCRRFLRACEDTERTKFSGVGVSLVDTVPSRACRK